jgi:hypothetical protein
VKLGQRERGEPRGVAKEGRLKFTMVQESVVDPVRRRTDEYDEIRELWQIRRGKKRSNVVVAMEGGEGQTTKVRHCGHG